MGELGFRKRESLGGRTRATRKRQARQLRRTATPAEERFWSIVRNSRLGAPFRRQQQIGEWIVDFYCHSKRLVVELEGGVHSGPQKDEADRRRKRNLEGRGLRVLAFENDLVLVNPLQVEADVLFALSQIPAPPPPGEGGARRRGVSRGGGRVGVEK